MICFASGFRTFWIFWKIIYCVLCTACASSYIGNLTSWVYRTLNVGPPFRFVVTFSTWPLKTRFFMTPAKKKHVQLTLIIWGCPITELIDLGISILYATIFRDANHPYKFRACQVYLNVANPLSHKILEVMFLNLKRQTFQLNCGQYQLELPKFRKSQSTKFSLGFMKRADHT